MGDLELERIFRPVAVGRASEEIALQIEAAIVSGQIKPGERLPSERELQTRFGLGRGVLREAIKMLQQKGLLEVRKGSKGGAFIRQLGVDKVSESLALFLKQHPVAPEKLIQFRESMDRTITQLAMTLASDKEKQELLQDALDFEALLRSPDPDQARVAEMDRNLNLKLAGMAGNPLFEWVMHALQMGFGSHDFTLYADREYRNKAAANWSDTARAIADNELMRALSFIGHHYVLLRQCVEEEQARNQSPAASLTEEDLGEAG